MNILFISHLNRDQQLYVDPSVRYRCFNFAEELSARGGVADVCRFRALTDVFLERYDVFIFHKPRVSLKLSRFLNEIKRFRKLAVADYDDLVFDERYAEYSPLYLNGRSALRQVRQIHAKYHDALQQFSYVTVSTKPLCEYIKACHPDADVKVVHNGLSTRWVHQGRFLFKKRENCKMIGYFPGTSSHDHDFPVVEAALMRFLSKYKNARLMIMGPLAFDKAKYEPGQIIIKKPVRYGWLPYWIKQCRITIAPLQNTSFNECKSALKFFESAIWGVPVVASPIPDMLRFQDTDIMFAHNGKEWQDCFEALYYSEHYDLISRNIQKYADEQCMAAFQVDSWLAFLRQSIEKLSNQT